MAGHDRVRCRRLLAEAFARVVLVALAALAVVHAIRSPITRLADLLLIVGSWFALELAWSLGTTNWGTGARHHVVVFPLLGDRGGDGPALHGRPHAGADGDVRRAGARV